MSDKARSYAEIVEDNPIPRGEDLPKDLIDRAFELMFNLAIEQAKLIVMAESGDAGLAELIDNLRAK